MPFLRSCLALTLIVAVARSGELRTLKGEVHKGNLVRITDKEVVFDAGGGNTITLPAQQILAVDLGPTEKLPAEATWVDVELVDGTILHCSEARVKGNKVALTVLLTGQKLELPLPTVSNLLSNAQNEKYRKDWTERVSRKRTRDIMAVLFDGAINPLAGTLGLGSDDGATISFTTEGGKQVNRKQETIHGLLWTREIDPNQVPPVCKLVDAHRNLVMAASVAVTADGLTATTPAGAKLEFPLTKVSKLDYSTGRLAYLSDLDPVLTMQNPDEDRLIDRYRRDTNLDGTGPMKMKGVTHYKGLALHAPTELEYDLKGDYAQFKAVVGFDDAVGGIESAHPIVLKIEGDGKELYKDSFTRAAYARPSEKNPKNYEISLNIKDVQRLRIIVATSDLVPFGKHLNLAEARVTK